MEESREVHMYIMRLCLYVRVFRSIASRELQTTEVNSENEVKPTEIAPITARTRDSINNGSSRLNIATALIQNASINTHNSSDPS